jgi:uncharacterized integral membrane protein
MPSMRWVLFLPLLILLVLFGLSNMQEVEVGLWPFDLAWVAPLSVAMLLFGALCFLGGALIAWAAALRERRRAKEVTQAARLLEAELATYKAREAEAARAAQVGRGPVIPGTAVAVHGH